MRLAGHSSVQQTLGIYVEAGRVGDEGVVPGVRAQRLLGGAELRLEEGGLHAVGALDDDHIPVPRVVAEDPDRGAALQVRVGRPDSRWASRLLSQTARHSSDSNCLRPTVDCTSGRVADCSQPVPGNSAGPPGPYSGL
jgi:hypothetical protein